MKMGAFAITFFERQHYFQYDFAAVESASCRKKCSFLVYMLLTLRMYSQPTPYPHTLIHSILKSDLASSFIMIGSPVAAGKRPDFK